MTATPPARYSTLKFSLAHFDDNSKPDTLKLVYYPRPSPVLSAIIVQFMINRNMTGVPM